MIGLSKMPVSQIASVLKFASYNNPISQKIKPYSAFCFVYIMAVSSSYCGQRRNAALLTPEGISVSSFRRQQNVWEERLIEQSSELFSSTLQSSQLFSCTLRSTQNINYSFKKIIATFYGRNWCNVLDNLVEFYMLLGTVTCFKGRKTQPPFFK